MDLREGLLLVLRNCLGLVLGDCLGLVLGNRLGLVLGDRLGLVLRDVLRHSLGKSLGRCSWNGGLGKVITLNLETILSCCVFHSDRLAVRVDVAVLSLNVSLWVNIL